MPTYPPVPGPRIAYDRNGTAVFYHDGVHAPTGVTTSQLVTMNDESDINDFIPALTGSYFMCFIFPQFRDIAAFGGRFGSPPDTPTYVLQTSLDSTNGLDGTWTNQTTNISALDFDPANPANRTTYITQSITGVGAVRFQVSGLTLDSTAHGVHLYGGISAGQTLDRVAFTDNFSNPLAGSALGNWGPNADDVIQASSSDIAFNITNFSPTRTANSIVLLVEALTDTTPSVAGQYLISLDGTNFYSTVTITSLTPGQSAPVTLRRATPANAALSTWSPRIVARPGSWV